MSDHVGGHGRRRALVRSQIAGWMLMSCCTTPAFAQHGQSTPDRQRFFLADPETVRAAWGARALDASAPLDRRVLEVMTTLQAATQVAAAVYWKNGSGAETHPRLGIGLDSVQLRRFQAEDGESNFRSDLLLVLAHELGHVAQSRRYSVESLADTAKGRAIETHADLLAGMAVMWVLVQEHADSAVTNEAMRVMTARLASLGSHDYDSSHHPRAEQRARAFSTGLVAGVQILDLRRCAQMHDSVACDHARTGAERDREIRDLTEENFWDWSNRLAKSIAQYSGG